MLGSWADSLAQQAKDAANAAAEETAKRLQEAREHAEQQAKALQEVAEQAKEQAAQQAKVLQDTATKFESNMLFPGEEPPPPRRPRETPKRGPGIVATPSMMDSPREEAKDEEAAVLRQAIVRCTEFHG